MGRPGNPVFKCSGCVHKNTRNVLRGSNGVCPHCKTKMPHDNWKSGSKDVTLLIGLSIGEKRELAKMASLAGLDMDEIIATAVRERMRVWGKDPNNVENAVKQDVMLNKLYKR